MKRLGFALTATFIAPIALAQAPAHDAQSPAAAAEDIGLSRADRGDLLACLVHFEGPLAKHVDPKVREKLATPITVKQNFDESLWLVDGSEADAGLVRVMNVAGEAVALDVLSLPAPNPTKSTLVHFAWDGKKYHAAWALEASGHKSFRLLDAGYDALEEWKTTQNSHEREPKAIHWKPNFDALTNAYLAYTEDFSDAIAKTFPQLSEARADAPAEEKAAREDLISMMEDCREVPRFVPAMEKLQAKFKLPAPATEDDSGD